MESEPRNMDLWMQETLNSWAEQGTLSSEKSVQLHMRISELARQKRKNRFILKLYGLVTAILTCIWLLFVSCPVAAAAYASTPIHSAQSPQVQAVGIVTILICFFLNHHFGSQTIYRSFGVDYE